MFSETFGFEMYCKPLPEMNRERRKDFVFTSDLFLPLCAWNRQELSHVVAFSPFILFLSLASFLCHWQVH